MIVPFESIEMGALRRAASYRQLRAWLYAYAEKKNALRECPREADAAGFLARQAALRDEIARAVGYADLARPENPRIVEDTVIFQDARVTLRRMKIQIFEDLDLFGILALPAGGFCDLAVCCHGLLGTPEHIAGVVDPANYHDALDRLLNRGRAVFAPQLVLLRDAADDWPASYRSDMHLDALWSGISLAAVEILKIEGAVKCLKRHLAIGRAGICGLSYGGFYALYSCALIDELDWCVCSCYFNDRFEILRALGSSARDWEFPGMGGRFGDAEVAALICPRPLYIEVALRDQVLPAQSAIQEAQRVAATYRACGAQKNFVFDAFDGEHEFCLRALDGFLGAGGGKGGTGPC